ncbi:hypothetical protein ACFQU7_31220 [Pseudoroseomonas wenyumeiae]
MLYVVQKCTEAVSLIICGHLLNHRLEQFELFLKLQKLEMVDATHVLIISPAAWVTFKRRTAPAATY